MKIRSCGNDKDKIWVQSLLVEGHLLEVSESPTFRLGPPSFPIAMCLHKIFAAPLQTFHEIQGIHTRRAGCFCS